MYLEHFRLKEPPFSISPDPRYLYLSDQHREALAHLVFGVERDGGFILLTGEVGTGKTTICRCLVEQLPEHCDVALILNPRVTVRELLSTICDEFRIPYPAGSQSIKTFIDGLNGYLLDAHAKGRKAVLIIDEAQNLSPAVLEQVRLLTNLETTKQKLLQVILLGQPELREMLGRSELRQLSQRIIARFHLGPLTRSDVDAYIHHRLAVAGAREPLFIPSAVSQLFLMSRGIPRLINIIADRAMLGAYAEGESRVTPAIVKRAAREVLDEPAWKSPWLRKLAWGSSAAFLALALLVGWQLYQSQGGVDLGAILHQNGPRREALPPLRRPIPTAGQPAASPGTEGNTPAASVASRTETDKGWIPSSIPPASEQEAFQALFERWSIQAPPASADVAPCKQAEALGFLCLTGQGTLQDLARLNHPAVLKLFIPEDRAFFGTLAGIQGSTVTVIVGGSSHQLDQGEILGHWRGDYTLLWRPPPDYRGEIHLGEKGPGISWLRLQLSILQGRSAMPSGEAVFDQAMMEEVKRFQMEQGLETDGIVGPRTLIRLNALTGLDVPLLTPIRQGG
ncbi:MAG: AAA family ATPase [Syntrophobacteraceae bacterium]|jgi:general secretion pathway protein A|nr:AAA family ATPase [Syntrophobacteraceae bacterium]